MKLATFSPLPSGQPRPGLVVDDKRVVDIPAALGAGEDTSTMLGIIRAGAPMLERLRALAAKPPGNAPALADVKLHAPIPRPAKNVDRKSTRLNSSHTVISYAVFCLKKKKNNKIDADRLRARTQQRW